MNDINKIPTATTPRPRQVTDGPQGGGRVRELNPNPPQQQQVLHPAIVEYASFSNNMLEKIERLESELRRANDQIKQAYREADSWRIQAECERDQKEMYLRDRNAQKTELDVIVRCATAARDRAAQREER